MVKSATEKAREQVQHVQQLQQTVATRRAQAEAARDEITSIDEELTELGFKPAKAEAQLTKLNEELEGEVAALEEVLDTEAEDER